MKYITGAGISKIENALNNSARAEAKFRADKQWEAYEAVQNGRYAVMDVATKLGAFCECEWTTPRGGTAGVRRCVCGSTRKTMYARLARLRQREPR